MKSGMHKVCTTCAQAVHRFGASGVTVTALVLLAACGPAAIDDARLLRKPTVPIGAISRFQVGLFDGVWSVVRTAGGDWRVTKFRVAGPIWEERGTDVVPRTSRIAALGTGILRLDYGDGTQRDIWVLWTDPDHQTVAVGDPEGRFGFVAVRQGKRRADQIRAAEQVMDFNGYRTDTWTNVQ